MKETTVRKIVFLAAQTLWMNSWKTDFYNCFWFTCVCDIMEQLDQADSNDLMLTMTTQDIAEIIYWENNMVIQYDNNNKETTIEQLNSMFDELHKFKVHFMLNENKIIICEV